MKVCILNEEMGVADEISVYSEKIVEYVNAEISKARQKDSEGFTDCELSFSVKLPIYKSHKGVSLYKKTVQTATVDFTVNIVTDFDTESNGGFEPDPYVVNRYYVDITYNLRRFSGMPTLLGLISHELQHVKTHMMGAMGGNDIRVGLSTMSLGSEVMNPFEIVAYLCEDAEMNSYVMQHYAEVKERFGRNPRISIDKLLKGTSAWKSYEAGLRNLQHLKDNPEKYERVFSESGISSGEMLKQYGIRNYASFLRFAERQLDKLCGKMVKATQKAVNDTRKIKND